jgi:hypothetical protein
LARWVLVGLGIGVIVTIVPRSLPHNLWLPHRCGWPMLSFEPVPTLVILDTVEPVTYHDQLGAMETVWRSELARVTLGMENFAPFILDSSWRWFRFPNGHLITFTWRGIAVDLGLGILGGLAIAAFTGFARRRNPRYRDGHCSECGYDLTGNVSGICPECGCPLKVDAGSPPLVAAHARRMETTSALCVVLLVLALPLLAVIASIVAQTATEGARAGGHMLPYLTIACAVLVAGWVLGARRLRTLSAKQGGWKRALVTYHMWVLLLLITSVGAVFMVVYEYASRVHDFQGGKSILALLLVLALCGLLVVLYFWLRWGYRRATAPLILLSRRPASRIADVEAARPPA